MPTKKDTADALKLLKIVRENLDRVEKLLVGEPAAPAELDPHNPLNKQGRNLTERGVEVCYRLFDEGKSRYAVSQALDISFGAATHRHRAWQKLGGKDRVRQSFATLDPIAR
jgi:hypothetical protein